jgi:hypothetical protein
VGLAWPHVGPNLAIDLLVCEAIKSIRKCDLLRDKLVIEQRHDVQSRVGPNTSTKLDDVTLHVKARAALAKLGYTIPEAAKAVGLAWSHVGPNVAIDLLVRDQEHPKV